MNTHLKTHATAAPMVCDEDFCAAIGAALPALVLTGAGISCSSGIPTYRDEAGVWLRSDPIKHQEFITRAERRQRYWGRSLLGWPMVRDAKPNKSHYLLTELQRLGGVEHIVTQNVDRLHQRAGSIDVTDLHGRLDRVRCIDCNDLTERDALQQILQALNPQIQPVLAAARPDGDADLPDELVHSIHVPPCQCCGGTLMPDVVFFGGTIPPARVSACEHALARARSLLVIGSSLQVYSGFRFVRWAQQRELPVFVMNPGKTRADSIARRWAIGADDGLRLLHDSLS